MCSPRQSARATADGLMFDVALFRVYATKLVSAVDS